MGNPRARYTQEFMLEAYGTGDTMHSELARKKWIPC